MISFIDSQTISKINGNCRSGKFLLNETPSLCYTFTKEGDEVKDGKKQKPKLKYYVIFAIVIALIPIVIPRVDWKIKIACSITLLIVCFLTYFYKLELYAKWSETQLQKTTKDLQAITAKHDKLKREFSKLNQLNQKHEHISNQLIEHLNILAYHSNNSEKNTINKVKDIYSRIQHDELGKYHRKDEEE